MKNTLSILSFVVIGLAGLISTAQAKEPYCREFTKTIFIGGKAKQAYGTSCLQPDGSWQVISQNHHNNIITKTGHYSDSHISYKRPIYITSKRSVYAPRYRYKQYNRYHRAKYHKHHYHKRKHHYSYHPRDW